MRADEHTMRTERNVEPIALVYTPQHFCQLKNVAPERPKSLHQSWQRFECHHQLTDML